MSLSVYKAPEANAVSTAKRVKAEVEKWIGRMPAGVEGVLADDTTAFTRVFLRETLKTLLVALVLSPVLCAALLRPPPEQPPRVFLPFNWMLDVCRAGYLRVAGLFVRRLFISLPLFALAAFALWWTTGKVPTAFLPEEDRGYITLNLRLSEDQSLERTIALVDEIHERAARIPGVASPSSPRSTPSSSACVRGRSAPIGGILV